MSARNAPIPVQLRPGHAPPNVRDYDAARRETPWATAWAALDGLPGGGLNIAHEAVDRHAAADDLALLH